jgi:hypothetical protein
MIEYVQYYMCCRAIYEFMYVYYGSFVCTNLVDIMPLFSPVFLFHLPIFSKNHPISYKIRP